MSVPTFKHMQHHPQDSMVTSQQLSHRLLGQRSRLTRVVLAMAFGMGLPVLASAYNNPPPAVRADAPDTYIVKKGDTLWDISGQYLKDAWRWKEIWAVNPQVKNPHWIYPGDRLLLCMIHGHKMVGVDQGDGCEGMERRFDNPAEDNTVRLEPEVRITDTPAAIPAVPLTAIKEWLVNSDVVTADSLKKAPYILGVTNNRVISGAGDTVYVRGKLVVGDNYGIYHPGGPYIDPKTKEILGYEARLVARGLVTAVDDTVSTVKLTDTLQQEVRQGDKVMAENVTDMPGVFYPTNAQDIPTGSLIRVMDGSMENAGTQSTIAINRGEREGVKVGQVFAIYQRGAKVVDPEDGALVQLPSERAGLALVFRTFDKLSYAIILQSTGAIQVGDELRPPVATN